MPASEPIYSFAILFFSARAPAEERRGGKRLIICWPFPKVDVMACVKGNGLWKKRLRDGWILGPSLSSSTPSSIGSHFPGDKETINKLSAPESVS